MFNLIFENTDKQILKERVEKALSIAWSYGQIDGSHHKTWVIDQMVKELCGNDEVYKKWIDVYETPIDVDCADYYQWDTGIAP